MESIELKSKPEETIHNVPVTDIDAGSSSSIDLEKRHLKRKLRSKEIQMYCMGTTIGTSLFVQMGSVLPKGGPAGLLLGFVLWSGIFWCINECFAEMVCYLPIPSPFATFGGQWVDEAFGFAMSWNFFIKEALLIPYEIVAFNILLEYWTDEIPVSAVIVVIILIYAVLHLINVRYYGITEMYMATFKLALMVGLIFFTFITMLGGNPLHDRFGFRYWKKPGAFVEYKAFGAGGRFLGALVGVLQAAFTFNGPEYISMIASEAELPRKVMPKAFKHVTWRFIVFFIGSALCIGILVPYNDTTLASILAGTKSGSGTAAASPYVIAMGRLKISVLPNIVNALILTSVLSSGNGDIYAASRTLYGLSLTSHAPAFLQRLSGSSIPTFAVIGSLSFCLLAFLQVSTTSAQAITWLVSLVTACQMINYAAVAFTYRHFYEACLKQNIDRNTLPYKSRFQPYTSYIAFGGSIFGMLANGWTDFLTSSPFSVRNFFLSYTFVGVFPILYFGWKVVKGTRYVGFGMADLSLNGKREEIDEYEREFVPAKRARATIWIDEAVF